MRVRLLRAVWADAPPFPVAGARVCAVAGVYEAAANRHGAVWIALPGGGALGLKPGEYEVVADEDCGQPDRCPSTRPDFGAEVERGDVAE